MKSFIFYRNFKFAVLVFVMNVRSFFASQAIWISLFLFSLTLLFLFPFAFGLDVLRRFDVKIGSYWMIQEFLSALIILNMFKIEQEGHVFDLYASTGNSRLAFFFGKVIFTTFYFLTLQIPLVFLWAVIFNLDGILDLIWSKLLLSNILFAFSSSLIGAFLYGITHRSYLKDLLQLLLFFPLQSPFLLAIVGLCLDAQNPQGFSAWWKVLFIYPVLFIGLSLIFGDTLFEE